LPTTVGFTVLVLQYPPLTTSNTDLQLGVNELHSFGKADISVVEIAEAAKCTDRQDIDSNTTNTRKNFPMNVILNNSRQAPANIDMQTITD